MNRLTCIQCPENEFTVNQNEHCEKCLDEGLCINGVLFNKAGAFKFLFMKLSFFIWGYWRSNIFQKVLTKCMPFSDSCLEKSEICDKGYVGPLCQTCNLNFSKFGSTHCSHCPNPQINFVMTIIITLMIIIFLSFYIRFIIMKYNF